VFKSDVFFSFSFLVMTDHVRGRHESEAYYWECRYV
jgi:hypothetical protein